MLPQGNPSFKARLLIKRVRRAKESSSSPTSSKANQLRSKQTTQSLVFNVIMCLARNQLLPVYHEHEKKSRTPSIAHRSVDACGAIPARRSSWRRFTSCRLATQGATSSLFPKDGPASCFAQLLRRVCTCLLDCGQRLAP